MIKVDIKFQIIDADGDNILAPYIVKESADYMATTYFPGSVVLEIEEILEEVL
jgi:hypothetical protein